MANFVERAVIPSHGEDENCQSPSFKSLIFTTFRGLPLTFHEAERKVILEALKAASGQISGHGGAAGRLGLTRTTLQNKTRRLGICKRDYQTNRLDNLF